MADPRKTAPRKRAPARIKAEAEGVFAGYSKEKRPLGGYAALVGLFSLGLTSAIAAMDESD